MGEGVSERRPFPPNNVAAVAKFSHAHVSYISSKGVGMREGVEHLYNIGIWRKPFRPFMAPLPLSERARYTSCDRSDSQSLSDPSTRTADGKGPCFK